ncbi:PREDICTED: uncharacterized protein LOC108611161 [Drosophila arizonae]|uniref:Kinetochore protein NDC80 n=1 Tax=Drosophila arizonae TaxID=7263 RepID=A0ABM1NVZ6_DROAR|nr:PREDICTED: uncharacterized protein LOC108611161 [Drosophila arizonae]
MDFKHSQSSNDDPESNALHQLRSPRKHFECFTEPRRIEELLKSPLHFKEVANCPSKSLNAVGSASKGICMQPRSTKELKQSPLHLVSKQLQTRSASKSTDFLSPYTHPKECGRPFGRKLDFTKEILMQMETRIVSYLRNLKDFQTMVKPGLQKVSLNDFMHILSHLIRFTGIRLKPFDRDNQIEQSILAMRQLKYPYKVNKSWMLVPSASFQNVLLMFDFLLDFAPQANESLAFNKNELSDETDMRLKQELMDIESQLLEQAQANHSISQQLDHKLRFEAEIQAQLNGAQEKLNALNQKSAKHELNMGRLCLQIWRSEKQREELKNRLSQEFSSYQAYGHILEEFNNQRLLHCIKAQELSERTSKELQSKFGNFNLHLHKIFGNHFNWFKLPLAPTLSEIRTTQLQLKQLRQQIEFSKHTPTLGNARPPLNI